MLQRSLSWKRTRQRFFKRKNTVAAEAFRPDEVDELVHEWQPEPLVAPVTALKQLW